jgi:hypothetical protein
MIQSSVLHSTATEVSSRTQVFAGRKDLQKVAVHLNQVQRTSSMVKSYVMQAHRCIQWGRQNQLHGDYKGGLPWFMNKSRKWSEKKKGKMFRQMARLKCLTQDISNFAETLDLVCELFLISSKCVWGGGGEQLQGRQKFRNLVKTELLTRRDGGRSQMHVLVVQ